MNFYNRLAPTLIGVSIVLIQSQVVIALSPEEVSKIAKEVTVLIQSQKPRYGSGVIIKHVGNTYTILTAAHVIDVADKYEILTADNQHYQLNYSSVKLLPGVDLAVAEFTSSRTYTVAKMGNSDTSIEGNKIYVAGYPEPTFAINQSIYTFTAGDLTANASKALRDGYALVYNNETKKGMSGGAVLNKNGELIGIHGRADLDTKETKTGFNLGIPINTYVRLSTASAPKTPVATAPKAADFFIQGGDKYQKRDYTGAIADYTAAIRLNPNYADAYNNRGIARAESGDKQGGIADYTQALRINPNSDNAYYNRGIAHYDLGDKQGAIADYNQALRINPNSAEAYNNRGNARYKSGDLQGGIGDYNQALRINPNSAEAYNNRGSARDDLRDKQGAIADYNQALHINPNYALAYYNRGITRDNSGDKQGAIADLQKAADLSRQQRDTQLYQKVQDLIKKLQ